MKIKKLFTKILCGALIISGCGFYNPKAMAQELDTVAEETQETIDAEDINETEDVQELKESFETEEFVDPEINNEEAVEEELSDEEEAEEDAILVENNSTLQPTAINNLCVRLIKTTYLVATDTGYMRVIYNGEKIVAEYYDSNFNLLNKKLIDLELPVWGGFYAGNDAYYIAEGQYNNDENDDAEFIRIIKYDKDWKRIGAAGIKCGTSYYDPVRTPFFNGNVEMVESAGSLYLVTGHEGYVDPAYGMGHQGYLMIKVDTATMTGSCIDSDLWHSLAQYIKVDGSKFYVLEQSEGSRYTKLSSYDTTDNLSKDSIPVLNYGGSRTSGWAIACYASVDDLAVSENNILGLGTSIDQSLYNEVSSNRDTMSHNIYLTVTPKNNFTVDATTVKWITNYSGDGKSFIGVNITKINDNKFLLAWEETDSSADASTDDTLSGFLLHYVFVDGDGNVISDEFTARAPISDCHPILNGSKVVYCASSTNMVDFYTIDTVTGAFSKKTYRVAGENSTWEIDEDGALTVSGEGALSDDVDVYYRYPLSSTKNSYSYSQSDNDWNVVRNNVTKIIVNSGITTIPYRRYAGFNNLTEVELANGVVSIGKEAFYLCNNLRIITIPRSVTEIGDDIVWVGSYYTGSGAHVTRSTIYAYRDSVAAQYAQDNNISFKGIGDITSVSLDSKKLTLDVGKTHTFTATVLPEDALNKSLTWTSSDTGVATVDVNGKVTAISVGTATITATAADGTGKYATCTVNVIKSVTSVTLDNTSISILVNKSKKLEATVLPDDAGNKALTWTSSDTSIVTVNNSGNVYGCKVGTATITATAKDGSGKSASCTVTVKQPVTRIDLSSYYPELYINETKQLIATVSPDNAGDKTVTWESKDPSIATVDNKGNITGKKAGSTEIKVTANDGSGKWTTCMVYVKQPVTSISLDKTSIELKPYESQKITAVVFPDNANNTSVTWSSSNPSVVTVYSNGLVYANSPGTATITATASDGSGIYTNCIVYVEQNHDNYDFGDDSGNDDRPNQYYGTLTASGIYCASTSPAIVAGMVTEKSNPSDVIEYRWIVCEEKDPNKWLEISPWKKNNEWLNWTPEKSGNYVIVGQARIVGKESSEVQASFGTPYHKNIKGICQMPYAFGGYLIGIESFDNPNNSYKYEMLILDCTLYAQGLPAWTYTTGKCYASGNCLWTVWQPEYGYYWTLFRIYDENDNLIDEACFGFENVN